MDIQHAEHDGKAARVTAELAPGWSVTMRLVPRGGSFEIAELRAYPTHDARRGAGGWCGHPEHVPQGGLPLRRLTGDLRLSEFSDAARSIEGWETLTDEDEAAQRQVILTKVGQWRRMAEDHDEDPAARLAPLAWGYSQLLAGGWRNPNALLAEALDRPRSWVGNELYRARHIYDLLDPAPDRAKAGGDLTPKAKSLVDKLNEAWATEAAEEQEGYDA